MKALASLIAGLLFLLPVTALAQATVSQGGTGTTSVAAGSFLVGSVPSIRMVSTAGALFWDVVNGRLGIGVTSPSSKLNVYASDSGTTLTAASAAMIDVTNSNTTNNNFADLTFSTLDSALAPIVTSKIAGVNTVHTAGATSGDLAFMTRNAGTISEKTRILANGNVGIGTTTPGVLLSVANPVISTTLANLYQGGNGTGNALSFTNVGNGTSAAIGNINGLLGTGNNFQFYRTGSTLINFSNSNGVTTYGSMGFNATQDLVLTQASTTRYMLINGGNVGVGTTTPATKLQVTGVAGANPFRVASSTNVSMFEINQGGSALFNNDPGTSGYVLQSFGSNAPPQWVATTTLGLSGTTYTGTYPVQVTGSVISLAFGTTTSNTWAGTQTFTNDIVVSGTATSTFAGGVQAVRGYFSTSIQVVSDLITDITGFGMAVVGGALGLDTTGAADEECLTYESTGPGIEWQPCSTTVFSTTQVFTGTSPTSWTDMDLSSVIGANQKLVMLVASSTNTSNTRCNWRAKGDTRTFDTTGLMTSGSNTGLHSGTFGSNAGGTFSVMVKTSTAGVVQWFCSAGISTVSVSVEAAM